MLSPAIFGTEGVSCLEKIEKSEKSNEGEDTMNLACSICDVMASDLAHPIDLRNVAAFSSSLLCRVPSTAEYMSEHLWMLS